MLAVTGYTLDKEIQELRQAGFAHVLHKPLDAPTLAQAVRRALDEAEDTVVRSPHPTM